MQDLFPFISVEWRAGRAVCTGSHNARLGYHLPRPDGHDDGLFAEWNWDGLRLEARVDWLGVHPLFYGHTEGRVVVSNNVLRILEAGIPADLDWTAIGVFFRLGFMVDCDTPFRHIRAMPPGGRLVFENGRLSVTAKYPEAPLNDGISRKQEKETYIELTRQAIARRIPLHGEFIQPLSGGRDSRHIVAELARQGCRPRFCYTIETVGRSAPGSEERIAAEVAARLGLAHKVLKHPIGSEIEREGLKNALTNFAANEGAWMLGALRALGEYPEVIYDGFLGDVLSAFHWPTAPGFCESYRTRGTSAFIDVVLRRFSPSKRDIGRVLAERFGKAPEFSEEQSRARITAFFETFTHLHNPITLFFIFSRGRREIAMSTWGCYPFLGKILAPFLDRDFFLFYLGLEERVELPYGHTRGEAIAAAFPAIANLPYAMSPRPTRIMALVRRVHLGTTILLGSHAGIGCEKADLLRWAWRAAAGPPSKSLDLNSMVYLQQIAAIQSGDAGSILGRSQWLLNQLIN